MSKIIFEKDSNPQKENNIEPQKKTKTLPNLFKGRTSAEIQNAKFPDWDIVPPHQIINPRRKN